MFPIDDVPTSSIVEVPGSGSSYLPPNNAMITILYRYRQAEHRGAEQSEGRATRRERETHGHAAPALRVVFGHACSRILTIDDVHD